MHINLISIVGALYLVSTTFAAPISAPIDANNIAGQLSSGLTGIPQGVAVSSSVPATSAAGVDTFGRASGYDDIPNPSANSKTSESAAMKKKVDEMESSLPDLKPKTALVMRRRGGLVDTEIKDNDVYVRVPVNVDAKDIKVL